MSQRLVRRTCPECAKRVDIPEELRSYLTDEEIDKLKKGSLRRGKGCKSCNDGYLGLIAVAEYIIFDNEIRDFFIDKHGIQETLDYLIQKKGYVPLWKKGLELVATGQTSLEEVIEKIGTDR